MSEISSDKSKNDLWSSTLYILIVLATGIFMTTLDTFIFAPSLPTIVVNFKTSLDWVAWTMTIYLLVVTAVMPLGGKLSDLFGRKKIFIAGITFFTIGSILSSLSWDIYSLIAFRAVQALGGALVMPASMSMVNNSTDKDKRGKTLGILMATSAVALIIGPNLGGYLIQNFGWRSVFLINIPIGILTILMALKLHEHHSVENGIEKPHIDVIGSLLLVGGLASALLGIIRLGTLPLTDITVFPLFITGLFMGILLYFHEKRVSEPILDIPTIMRGNVLSLCLSSLLLFSSFSCVIMYVPSFAQLVLNMNVQDSGMILTSLPVMLIVSGILGGVLIDRFGAKVVLLLGTLITSAGLLGLALSTHNPLSVVIPLAILGLGLGGCMSAFQIIIMSFMPEGKTGSGSGILSTFQNIGTTIGSLIGGFFLIAVSSGAVTYDIAFKNIFWFGWGMSILSALLIVYMIVRHSGNSGNPPGNPS